MFATIFLLTISFFAICFSATMYLAWRLIFKPDDSFPDALEEYRTRYD